MRTRRFRLSSWPGLSGPSIPAPALTDGPDKPGHDDGVTDAERRRRGRSWAIMIALAALCALFYAITIVKMAHL
nr:hypothetical protein [uncultured Rhodopila sp.]